MSKLLVGASNQFQHAHVAMNDHVEIRVTRPSRYPPGYHPYHMDGHYFRGESCEDAKRKAEDRFPDEVLNVTVFKVLVREPNGSGIWLYV